MEGDYALVGRRSGRAFRMGDKVRIKVISANLAKRQLDYEWVANSTAKPEEGEVIAPKKEKKKSSKPSAKATAPAKGKKKKKK
jgi:ribonuclease R